MTREEAKEYLPIIKAYAEGKIIQCLIDDKWKDVDADIILRFTDSPSCYRIKPEPKYRPFNTQEECWNEMLKHQPFGWLKEKANKKEIAHIGRVFDVPNDTLITLSIDEGRNLSSSYFFRTYTFVDGTPFGIKEGNSYDSKAQ